MGWGKRERTLGRGRAAAARRSLRDPGFEKQIHAYDVIGDASWWVNLDAGTIVFGGELEMRAGLLGTEAAGTWLWGWANPGGFPEPVIAAAPRGSGVRARARPAGALRAGERAQR